ncbi:hypothetical protein [Paenibacillus sanguinis]|uniref:hypothetical protein n=1 Tax=Paenibacillus sanguinis TaxID=225906 RepID=UPI00035C19F5|nr:hypothetical protein [Paenibacillus sanguinis]
MFEDLNVRMADIKEQERNQKKWERQLKGLREELTDLQADRDRWQRRLSSEEEDVQRLSSMSLSNLIATLLGNKAEKLDREQREALEVKVRFDAAEAAVHHMKEQVSGLERKLLQTSGWKNDYERVFQAKEKQILEQDGELRELAEYEALLTVQMKEVQEALQAGQSVLHDLNAAADSLHSAKNWGTYDMLGGGMISTHIKHSHIDEAMHSINLAQHSLKRFERELRDVGETLPGGMVISDLLKFSDYFFDGLIVDWLVQGQIHDLLGQVQANDKAVSQVVRELEAAMRKLEAEWSQVNRKYVQMVENYR